MCVVFFSLATVRDAIFVARDFSHSVLSHKTRPPSLPPGLARRVARTAQCSSLRWPSARFPSRPGSSRRALCAVFSHFAGRLLVSTTKNQKNFFLVFYHFSRCLGYLTVYYVLFNGFFLNFFKTFSSLFNNFFFLFSFQHFMF